MNQKLLSVAKGETPADLVIRNGKVVNVYSGEIYDGGVAICGDTIAAVGDVEYCIGEGTRVVDAEGKYLTPGFLDGHIHPESSSLAIRPFAEAVQASHDVTVKQAQLQQAQEDNVALGVAYEKAFDQSAVKAAAQAAGMTKPTTDQIEYIELGGADMAEICRPESTGPLAQAWNWVKNGVDAVVEYFR